MSVAGSPPGWPGQVERDGAGEAGRLERPDPVIPAGAVDEDRARHAHRAIVVRDRAARGVSGSLETVETLLIACDFDGTITERDTLHLIVAAFGSYDLWERIEPRVVSGELSIEQAMQEEFAVGAGHARAGARPGAARGGPAARLSASSCDWARERDHRLIVFSSGFRSVIDDVLDHWGIEGLEVVSHEARFSRGRLPPGVVGSRRRSAWSAGRRCKRHDLRGRSRGERLVYIGDGVSDRCGARMADVIFARAQLADDLAAGRRPLHPVRGLRPRPGTARRALDAGRMTAGWRDVPPASAWGEMEERVLAFWRERDIFARSLQERAGA